MPRSLWKTEQKEGRGRLITPELIGEKIEISNGKIKKEIKITTEQVGHKIGEFHYTKKQAKYKCQKR